MSYNYHLNEHFVKAHQQDLLREAEQRRLIAQLPRRNIDIVQYVVARIRTLFARPTLSTKQVEPRTVTGQL